jgi:hypothetical protein
MDKQRVIDEIRRAARGAESLGQNEFEKRSEIGLTTVRNTFGTWNQAVAAAGLVPLPSGGTSRQGKVKVSDEDYLQEIVRLTEVLGKKVTEAEMNAKGCFSVQIGYKRWGSFAQAREAAYALFECQGSL